MIFFPCFKFYSLVLEFSYLRRKLSHGGLTKVKLSVTHYLNVLRCNFEIPNFFIGRKVSFSKMQNNAVNSFKNWTWPLTLSHLILARSNYRTRIRG